MKDNYLIHGTNALKGSLRYLHGDTYRYEPKSVGVYLSVACQTLSYLLDDIETIEQISEGLNLQVNVIYKQFDDFIEEFERPDRALLVAAGMDIKMVDYLFRDIHNLRLIMKNKRSIKRDLLRERIKELQYSVCQERESLENSRTNINLLQSIRVIGGGAIITTNYAADSIIGGLASALSQAFGGYILGKGLDRGPE